MRQLGLSAEKNPFLHSPKQPAKPIRTEKHTPTTNSETEQSGKGETKEAILQTNQVDNITPSQPTPHSTNSTHASRKNRQHLNELEHKPSFNQLIHNTSPSNQMHTTHNRQSSPTTTTKSTSKLVQLRIKQACLFTQTHPEILLSSDIQADYIRGLVLCSLDVSERNTPMLSLLLHCTSAHLKMVYERLRGDETKKLSIHIFRQLQSDLQPEIFE